MISIQRIRDSYLTKGLAFYLVFSLLIEFVFPNQVLALTSGPAQEEFASFEPVGTTDLVDLYTGDFTYNIPLLTVPGPNGGYPINIAYHSGVGMEQEASWVGLGWNINVGAINRQLRGLPDDFKGDEITNEMTMKQNDTYSLSMLLPLDANDRAEIFGFNASTGSVPSSTPVGVQISYNNYNGFGYAISPNISLFNAGPVSMGLSLNIDSQHGVSATPSMTLEGGNANKVGEVGVKIGATINSRTGYEGYSISATASKATKKRGRSTSRPSFGAKGKGPLLRLRQSATLTMSYSNPVPNVPIRTINQSYPTRFELGDPTAFGVVEYPDIIPFPIQGSYTTSNLIGADANGNAEFVNSAYGYLRTEYAGADDLTDFSESNSIQYNRKVPNLSPSSINYDIYSISGQGTGGMFRPYRREIGVYSNPRTQSQTESYSNSVEFALEAGSPPTIHLGYDFQNGTGGSYYGPWQSLNSIKPYLRFNDKEDKPLQEPSYFKMYGEQTVQYSNETVLDHWNDDDAIRTNIDYTDTWDGRAFESDLIEGDGYSYNPSSGSYNALAGRVKRAKHIGPLMGEEVSDYGFSSYVSYTNDPNGTPEEVDKVDDITVSNQHHLNEISVRQQDGMIYTYGLPAYNNIRRDASFRVDDNDHINAVYGQPSDLNKVSMVEIPQSGGEIDPVSGTDFPLDEYVSITETPDYVHSWMLTSVVANDYEDLTGDGPTDDDYGYWVKFHYRKVHDAYKWREPYNDANFAAGSLRAERDNMGMFTYGTKEIFYLDTIETRTHIAVFELADRHDAVETSGELASSNPGTGAPSRGTAKLQYVRSIKLYLKSALENNPNVAPIKTVNFKYSYDLCQGVPNNDNSAISGDDLPHFISSLNNGGKLTLEEISFNHEGSTRGSLSPYKFDYGSTPNKDYSKHKLDNWGNYKNNGAYPSHYPYVMFPYPDQYDESISEPSAWLLNSIKLPSGGELKVEYENDEYAFVEDIPAMQMYDIVSVGPSTEVSMIASPNGREETDVDIDDLWEGSYIFFNLERTGWTDEEFMDSIVQDLTHVYFKTEVAMNYDPIGDEPIDFEFVEGFAEIDRSNCGVNESGDGSIGYVRVEPVQMTRFGNVTGHPVQKAALQHLNINIPQVKYGEPNNSGVNIQSLVSPLQDMLSMIYGKYVVDMGLKRGQYINLSGHSQVRLFTSGSKIGGGSRVKKISISERQVGMDNITGFDTPVETYGQIYEYEMEDGTSSGVAYEPVVGMEESSLVQPILYSESIIDGPNEYVVKKPIMKDYYPSASVGYRRVVVKSINRDNYFSTSTPGTNTDFDYKSLTPVSEYLFYSPKDFPVIIDETDLTSHKPVNRIIPIPGMQVYKKRLARSQGYSVVLNDMAGKPKKIRSYTSDPDGDEFKILSETSYRYQTKSEYDPNSRNELENSVECVLSDGSFVDGVIGESEDIFFVMNESRHESFGEGVNANLEFQYPLFALIPLPNFSENELSFKSSVGHKIIHRSGVLKETETWDGKSRVVTENLYYDAETGVPLISRVINEFEDPVYSTTFPGHWYYSNLGGAYNNIGAEFSEDILGTSFSATVSGSNAGELTISDGSPLTVETYFTEGDELALYSGTTLSTRAHIIEVNTSSDYIKCIDEDGDLLTTSTSYDKVVIINSGNVNSNLATCGNIVSLGGMPFATLPPVFQAFNDIDWPGITGWPTTHNVDAVPYEYCSGETASNGDEWDFDISSDCTIDIDQTFDGELCSVRMTVDNCVGAGVDLNSPSLVSVDFVSYNPVNQKAVIRINDGTSTTDHNVSINEGADCLDACYKGVLQASAIVYDDEWTVNCRANGCGYTKDTKINPYAVGLKGNWKPKESYTYITDRVNDHHLRSDGVFDQFHYFKWTNLAGLNDNWRRVNTITLYSSSGFALENQDALGNYSSALYGYSDALAIAVASNSKYYEMLYDGFEDYNLSMSSGCEIEEHHWDLGGTTGISSEEAHSGTYSYKFSSSSSNTIQIPITIPDCDGVGRYNVETTQTELDECGCLSGFKPAPNVDENGTQTSDKKYFISFWVKQSGKAAGEAYDNPKVTVSVTGGGSPSYSITPESTEIKIEGWLRVIGTFTVPVNATQVDIKLENLGTSGGDVYFDDLRIHPFDANMVSYVYDPSNLKPVAQLDANNYATYFIYDEEGALIQKKIESELGILTTQEGRTGNIIE